MIHEIRIANTASYGPVGQVLSSLPKFNYIYGPNGAGKTTISRLIADASRFPSCSVIWQGGAALRALVFNSDFVEANIASVPHLKGVFTLGENQVEAQDQIARHRTEIDDREARIQQFRTTLQGEDGQSGKRYDLVFLEDDFKERCWREKVKHEDSLKGAMQGVLNSKENFKNRVLSESSTNQSELLPLETLKERHSTVFNNDPQRIEPLAEVNFNPLLATEKDDLLSKTIVGREDVDIAAMIQRLGNADWVSQGLPYFESNNEESCPFCQQPTPASLRASLDQFFDEAYSNDVHNLATLAARYEREKQEVMLVVDSWLHQPNQYRPSEQLVQERNLLERVLDANLRLIADKIREPSRRVQLESIREHVDKIHAFQSEVNRKTQQHNLMVENLAKERAGLSSQVWRYIVSELGQELEGYRTRKHNLQAAIQNLETQIDEQRQGVSRIQSKISELERQSTSLVPTIDEINRLLSSFGFTSFSLESSRDGQGYQLLRSDRTDAKPTLSEGERSFLAFLYFYHLVKGSHQESGLTEHRIVVFDDPVSSLDSEVLFVVSSLIRQVIEEVRNGTGLVKQVFVMTHNVYFHREVTYNSRRPATSSLNEEAFWCVRKAPASTVERFDHNPVKSTYELLWAEMKRQDSFLPGLQNAMRRILETYFKILGRMSDDDIVGKFEGKEIVLCRSLLSWTNAGSHHVYDDLQVLESSGDSSAFRNVFKRIFEVSGHEAHYTMMMNGAAAASPGDQIHASPASS